MQVRMYFEYRFLTLIFTYFMVTDIKLCSLITQIIIIQIIYTPFSRSYIWFNQK